MPVEDWGFSRNERNELVIGGVSAVDLAQEYGTPLHVVDEGLLRLGARSLRQAFEQLYPEVELFYALKCNSVAALARTIFDEGFGAEVMSEFELLLARHLGMPATRIVLSSPNKSDPLLEEAVKHGVGTIVVDSLSELSRLERIGAQRRMEIQVLLRVNPDFVPSRMSAVANEGSRKASVFGLDLRGGELAAAFERLRQSKHLRYAGLHAHIGSGLRCPNDYRHAFRRIKNAFKHAQAAGFVTRIFDYGGGFGVPTSKGFTTLEFLSYQGLGCLPQLEVTPLVFAPAVCQPIKEFCHRENLPLPKLYLEPGRAIAAPPQILLLTVGVVKDRPGAGKWLITDGGAGTCAFPLYYEYHEIFVANDLDAPRVEKVNMIGPAFLANWIYRNKKMPSLKPGDIIAIMDAGAYFLALEANFGFPRTPVVMVSNRKPQLVRRRETLEELAARDLIDGLSIFPHGVNYEKPYPSTPGI